MQLMKSREGAFMHAYDETEVKRLESLGWVKAKEGDQSKRTITVKQRAKVQ